MGYQSKRDQLVASNPEQTPAQPAQPAEYDPALDHLCAILARIIRRQVAKSK